MIFVMPKKSDSKKRIYLDNAAATPVDLKVLLKMKPYFVNHFGNPSAIHKEGQVARQVVEEARQEVAKVLGIKNNGVIFTGSGTESNNLAIVGYIEKLKATGKKYSEMEIVTTEIEHPSILALSPKLKQLGVKIKFVAVDEVGLITVTALEKVLSQKTVLVTFAYANSEVGTVQPVSRLARVIRNFAQKNAVTISIHLDAAQAPLWLPCAFAKLGVDSMALDSGKCSGPKGVGILASRRLSDFSPITFGGGQESGLRPGTENVVGIVGASTALALAQANYEKRSQKVSKIRDDAMAMILNRLPDAVLNGSVGQGRLANNINISLPGFDSEYAVVFLDSHGVAASTKSACAGAGSGLSHVVEVMTKDKKRASSTIRLSLGEKTTKKDLERAVNILEEFCQKMKTLTQ